MFTSGNVIQQLAQNVPIDGTVTKLFYTHEMFLRNRKYNLKEVGEGKYTIELNTLLTYSTSKY